MRTTKNISITMPPDMLKDAEKLAKVERRTMSELIREAFRYYMLQNPSYPENEIIRALKSTRQRLWRERYAKKVRGLS